MRHWTVFSLLRAALLAATLLWLATAAHAQGASFEKTVITNTGRPVAGALVRICTHSPTQTNPCGTLATIYGNVELTGGPIANPTPTDGYGNVLVYMAPAIYDYTVSGNGIITTTYKGITLNVGTAATIAGSIANTQVAYGTAVNTIGGNANFTQDPATRYFQLSGPGGGFFGGLGPALVHLNVDDGDVTFHTAFTNTAGPANAVMLLGMEDTGNSFMTGYWNATHFGAVAIGPDPVGVRFQGDGVGDAQGNFHVLATGSITAHPGTGQSFIIQGTTSGTIDLNPGVTASSLSISKPITVPAYNTTTNCADPAGAAACGSAAAGMFVVDAGATTVVVSTTAMTANSEVFLQYDSSLSARLGITCNTTVALPSVTARTAGTSFTISVPVAPITNPACYSFHILN